MKKSLLSLLLILLLTLSSCTLIQSYDEIYKNFNDHLEDNQEIYQEKINFINTISTDLIKGVVKVKKTSGDQMIIALGSGLIFDEDPIYYYVLTNNHVVYDVNIPEATYTVYDYQNNVYTAKYMTGSNDYDLAVLRIRKRVNLELNIFVFAQERMELNNHLTTMGYPESQLNAINMGLLLDYGPITIDVPVTVINVEFDVMIADLPVKTGSSGSAAIDDNLELVGIIFAGNFTGGSNIADYAFLLPIDKVKEFLTLNEYEYLEAEI